MDSRKKKIAIITPRYGREAAGQVPYAAAALARRLAAFYSVTVLTSTAKDYDSFANYYPEGESVEDGVKLLRFKTTSDRDEQSKNASLPSMVKQDLGSATPVSFWHS